MIRFAILASAPLATLGACAAPAAAQPSADYLAATLLADPIAGAPAGSIAVQPNNDVPRPPVLHGRTAKARVPAIARVEAANRASVLEPADDNYVGAVQVYPWAEGSLYRLYTAPGQVSDIALQPGETLVSVAAGDTVRWVIGDTSSGAGTTRRTHVLVKPSAAGLSTNLVIATDRRVYHVELESTAHAAMASISWTYPDDALVALRGGPQAAAAEPVAAVAVDALDFDYRIEGDSPPWRPVRVFDDGRQLFIEFPPTIAGGEAPPLFVLGEHGRAELVNYRVRGRYYVVDRLFAAAELRLGEGHQQRVRIVRGPGRPS
jgi:type IV secretion system protein TrbG